MPRTAEARRAAEARYRASEAGRAARARARSRYKAGERGRAAQARYAANDRGRAVNRAATARWAASERGRTAVARWEKSERGQASRARKESIRRATAVGAPGTHTLAEWLVKLAAAGGLCTYCRQPAQLTQDHVVPLSRGGSNSIDNLVAACLPCNTSKNAEDPAAWLARRWAASTAEPAVAYGVSGTL